MELNPFIMFLSVIESLICPAESGTKSCIILAHNHVYYRTILRVQYSMWKSGTWMRENSRVRSPINLRSLLGSVNERTESRDNLADSKLRIDFTRLPEGI